MRKRKSCVTSKFKCPYLHQDVVSEAETNAIRLRIAESIIPKFSLNGKILNVPFFKKNVRFLQDFLS